MPKSEEAKALEDIADKLGKILDELKGMRRDAQRVGR